MRNQQLKEGVGGNWVNEGKNGKAVTYLNFLF
jgi:hypothetical protein